MRRKTRVVKSTDGGEIIVTRMNSRHFDGTTMTFVTDGPAIFITVADDTGDWASVQIDRDIANQIIAALEGDTHADEIADAENNHGQ